MYLVIISSSFETDVFYFKNKKDVTNFFPFEDFLMYDNLEIYKVNKIEKPILFYRKDIENIE